MFEFESVTIGRKAMFDRAVEITSSKYRSYVNLCFTTSDDADEWYEWCISNQVVVFHAPNPRWLRVLVNP